MGVHGVGTHHEYEGPTIGVNLVGGEGKVRLLHIQVDVCGNGCIRVAVDSFAQRKPGDEICADYLLGSLGYGNRERCRFGVRDWLEPLTLFTASDVFVDESMHKRPPIVTLDQFQSEVMTWVSGCD